MNKFFMDAWKLDVTNYLNCQCESLSSLLTFFCRLHGCWEKYPLSQQFSLYAVLKIKILFGKNITQKPQKSCFSAGTCKGWRLKHFYIITFSRQPIDPILQYIG